MNRKGIIITLLCLITLGFYACSDKDDSSTDNNARLRILLTDDPADYDEVNIDIQDVQINPQNGDNGWASLDDVNTGIFDLLELTGGLDLVLADVELPAGRISQLRLILGDDNTVMVDGDLKDLKTPSGQQTGVKILINTDLEAGVTYTILLDFDAARSVVQAGNSGQFLLKPVIRATVEATSGSIQGTVTPANVQSVVYAIMNMDTLSTFTNDAGKFLIRGVPEGTYRVEVVPEETSGLDSVIIENVEVTTGQVTNVGTVNLEN